jgi:hypothetical protein
MKLCNFKSTTTNDYIHKAASLLGDLSCRPTVWPPLPAQTCARHAYRSPPGSQSLPVRHTHLPRRLTNARPDDRSRGRQIASLPGANKRKPQGRMGTPRPSNTPPKLRQEARTGRNNKKTWSNKRDGLVWQHAPVRRERGTCPPATLPPEQYLTASGKLMRPSAVAYVLFLCDRPKPHATPMQVQGHT